MHDNGTTVTLCIPLTLAIIGGLLVEAGPHCLVVPLANVSSCQELSRSGPRRQSLVMVRDQLVRYVVLRDRFGISGEMPRREQVTISETVKKLGTLYRHVEEVSLILDVDKIAGAAAQPAAVQFPEGRTVTMTGSLCCAVVSDRTSTTWVPAGSVSGICA